MPYRFAVEPWGRAPGPLRRRLEERFRQRHGLDAPSDLSVHELTVGPVARTYWTAPPPDGVKGPAPVLLVLHGAGGQGPGMAAMTGLHCRGPAAGFITVFPDGHGRVWNDARDAPGVRRRRSIDDVAFLQALVRTLASDGAARADGVYLAGMSNGALMAEHLARHGLLPVTGIALVAGPGTQTSRRSMPRPARGASVALFAGTHDPLMPYGGGPIGPIGRIVQRRRRGNTDRGLAVGAEDVARDWAAANGIDVPPSIESWPGTPDGLRVIRMEWRAAGRPPVVLYRIEGGGHAWPGGPPYLPERFIGPVTRSLDASGILLEQFRAQEAGPS